MNGIRGLERIVDEQRGNKGQHADGQFHVRQLKQPMVKELLLQQLVFGM